jgi:hypothetical protein
MALPLMVWTLAGTFVSGVPIPSRGVVPTTTIGSSWITFASDAATGGAAASCAQAVALRPASALPKHQRSANGGLRER